MSFFLWVPEREPVISGLDRQGESDYYARRLFADDGMPSEPQQPWWWRLTQAAAKSLLGLVALAALSKLGWLFAYVGVHFGGWLR